MKFSYKQWIVGLCLLGSAAPAATLVSWEFNTPGDTENWEAGKDVAAVGISNAISGGESVLTATDITGGDAQIKYNDANTLGLWLNPGAEGWGTIVLRMRLLDKNPGEAGVAPKAWPDVPGTLVLINPGVSALNTGPISTSSGWNIIEQADHWFVASYDISSLGTEAIKTIRVDPIAQDDVGNFEIDSVQLTSYNSGPYSDPYIVATEQVGDSLKIIFETELPLSDLMLVAKTNLTDAGWTLTTYSTNGVGDFLQTDLSAAVPEGDFYSVHVPLVHGSDFYSIDATPQSNWFGVVATSDARLTTHEVASGDFIVGISDIGGGYINRIVMPAYGDIMGFQADKYGRGGQSSIRGSMHGGKYNPTQAGFSDPAGTICRVCTTRDERALVVAPRPCCLFRGDSHFDFTEWENLADDRYVESGGSNDWDTIDESLFPGKQATEVTSEFDYYCTYENKLGTTGELFGATNAITIPAIRNYYEYRYIRDPGHCIQQHILGPLFDPVAGEVTDISVASPAGIQAATSNDLGMTTWSMSIRIDRAIWTAGYVGTVDGSTIGDLSMDARTGIRVRQTHEDVPLASRAPAYSLPTFAEVEQPLFILADSDDIDQGGALGLYYPNSTVNEKCVIGVDRATGAVLYEDDRRVHTELRDQPERTPSMSWNGFRGHILGILNPQHLPATQYEAFRGEFYMLYGSPREIFENAQRIQPF